MVTIRNHVKARKMVVLLVGIFFVCFSVVEGVVGNVELGTGQEKGSQSLQSLASFLSQNSPKGFEAKISSDDAQTSDFFGSAIAADGDTIVAGALGEKGGEGDPIWHAGAAYIFERNQGGVNNWGQVAKLTADNPGVMDQFGQAVAISGDTVAVGAPYDDGSAGNPIYDAGAVYIFERNQGGPDNWGQVIKVTAGDPDEEDDFGISISLHGDTLVAGAPGKDGGPGNPMTYVGAVYVFKRNQGGPENWGQVAKLAPGEAEGGDGFGSAVAIHNDTLVAGSPTEGGGPGNPMPWSGAAYVFERNHGGPENWGEVNKLTGSDTQTFDHLGFATAVYNDTIIVGAPFEEGGPGDPYFVAGAAYVFERNQGGPDSWGEVARLAPSDPGEGDYFGRQVALFEDLAVAGSSSEKGGPGDPLPLAGAAYLFGRDEGGANNWGEIDKLVAGDAESGDLFGSSLAINADGFIFIGAVDGDVDGTPPVMDSGAAYIINPSLEVGFTLYIPYMAKQTGD